MFSRPPVARLSYRLNLWKMQFRSSLKSNGLSGIGVCLALFFLCIRLTAQPPPLLRNFEYVETYSLAAVEQMLTHGIPASVTMAQAILESRSGSSELARRSNNHFGIKCHIEWGGDTILQSDDTLGECFRRYESTADSYTDHSLFLLSRSRYAHLFQLDVRDYAGWCYGLKNAGYATFPEYAEVLINLITSLNLHELDGPDRLLPNVYKPTKEEPTLKTSVLARQKPRLSELAEAHILFADEQDIHLRSLLHYIRAH
jgi:hypothetical protein